jgi:hypothetical protein
MTSPKQKAANRLNAIKSTGPRTQKGIRSASLNAVKHRLSLPVTEQLFGKEIADVAALVRGECISDQQGTELAKRIIDYERNAQFLLEFSTDEAEAELQTWIRSGKRLELNQLVGVHENKQKPWVTFTASRKMTKSKQRLEELSFLKGFVRIQDKVLLDKVARQKKTQTSALRYQKRAVNQLIKAAHHLARGEEF